MLAMSVTRCGNLRHTHFNASHFLAFRLVAVAFALHLAFVALFFVKKSLFIAINPLKHPLPCHCSRPLVIYLVRIKTDESPGAAFLQVE